jgi:hypothetical protein
MQSGQFVFQIYNPIKFRCNKIAYEGDSLEGLAPFNSNMSTVTEVNKLAEGEVYHCCFLARSSSCSEPNYNLL